MYTTFQSKKYITLFSMCLGLFFCLSAKAQNNTSSPYSMFGIGETDLLSNGQSTALGGTSLGVRNKTYLNPSNPASYTALDSMRFYFETGIHLRNTWSSTNLKSQQTQEGNLTNILMGFRMDEGWYGGFGVIPKSSIGYQITTTKMVEGSFNDYSTLWTGTGGISQVYFSQAFQLSPNLSAGLNLSFLFGPLTQQRDIVLGTSGSTEYVTVLSNINYNGFLPELGLQYTFPLNGMKKLTLGTVFKPQVTLSGKSSDLTLHTSSFGTVSDTLSIEEEVVRDIKIPFNLAAGFAYESGKGFMLAADYQSTLWNEATSDDQYANQHIVSAGMEYTPNPHSFKFLKRTAYRLGFRYDTGYLKFDDQRVTDWRVTMGFGFPIKKGLSYINLALEAGQQGSYNQNLIRENYLKGTLTFSLSEIWFVHKKYD